ncbi:hypothetical protein Tco_0527117 [Tanacetum coccineum]
MYIGGGRAASSRSLYGDTVVTDWEWGESRDSTPLGHHDAQQRFSIRTLTGYKDITGVRETCVSSQIRASLQGC